MANQTEPARFLGSSARQHKGIYGFFLLLIPGAGSSKGAHSGRLFTERNTMSEETLVAHCSPVLAGLKTANMFNADCDDPQSLCLQLRELNLRLGPKGVRILPLRFSGSKALLYLYRPNRLQKDLEDETAGRILRDCGYPCGSRGQCLAHLRKKLQGSKTFPHEIGLFLGYPPGDVDGFIQKGPRCAKCTGYWQVYGDEEKALKTFERYRKCTDAYCAQVSCGRSLERLTVAELQRRPASGA